MGSYKYSENEVSWSLFAIGFEWIMSENRLSSLANTRSSKFGVCPSLLLVVLETIWVRKASLTHFTNMLSLMPDHAPLPIGKSKSPTIHTLSKVFTCSFLIRLFSSCGTGASIYADYFAFVKEHHTLSSKPVALSSSHFSAFSFLLVYTETPLFGCSFTNKS